MKHFKLGHKSFAALLCATAAFALPVQAGDIKLLPEISASEIAADTNRSYDSYTGITVVTAPTFDPFEQDGSLAGTAALRTGPSAITLDGQSVSGGAFLDLKMIYTSLSDDPYDVRGFERSVYLSGEPIARIHQDMRTLDCSSSTTDVGYQDEYYDGYGSHGYLAGLYLLLPRYRGHRGYWTGGRSLGPHANWRNWRRSGSYGFGTANSFSSFSSPRGGTSFNSSRGRTRGAGTRRNENTRGNGRQDSDTGGAAAAAPATTTRGTTRRDHSIIGGSSRHREFTNHRGIVRGGPLRTSDNTDTQASSSQSSPQSESSRTRARAGVKSTRRVSTAASRSRNSSAASNSTPAPIAQQASPAPIARQTLQQNARPSTPASRDRSQSKSSSSSKSRSSASSKSKPKRSSRVDRAVDRSFNRSRSRGKELNFFPPNIMPMQTSYGLSSYVHASGEVHQNFRCVREESVSLHIPQDRLDAARFDGLTLVIIDNAERDIPIYIPPNYIEGFRQAAGHNSVERSTYGYPAQD